MITKLLSVALGAIGLAYLDFCRLTPARFRAVFDSWKEMKDNESKTGWNQTRHLCYSAMRPYMRRNVDVEAFWQFPWEKPEHKGNGLTMEQEHQEFERIKRQYGV